MKRALDISNSRHLYTSMLCLLTLLLLGALALPAQARQTFTVNATADASDANPGDGICATSGGVCTLRAAIEEANALAGRNTIQFAIPAATDTGCNSSTGVCTITPQSALPTIIESLIIYGTTQAGATCDGSFASRSLKVVLDGAQAGSANGLAFVHDSFSIVRGLVIHSFQGNGLILSGLSNARVWCNNIGTDVTGTLDQGNGGSGIYLSVTSNSFIGIGGDDENSEADGNLISGNTLDGIRIVQSSGTVVTGNRIGTQIDGTSDLGNGAHGIWILGGANTNTIGGLLAAEANTIAHNTQMGVLVANDHILNFRNAILGNRIFSNGSLGIDLQGASANDLGDPDPGANQGQNHPVMTSALVKPNGDVIVNYLVDTATRNAAYPLRVEFFLADADSSEGMTLLGGHSYASSVAQDTVTTTFTPVIAISGSEHIVATATDAYGNTSEFSGSMGFATQGTVNATADRSDTNAGDGICYTGQTNSTGAPECTLRAAMEEAQALTGANTIQFAIPSATDTGCDSTTGVCTIKPQSALPTIRQPLTVDGTTQAGATCGTGFATRDLKVVLDGSQAGNTHGLFLAGAPSSTVRGFVIHGFQRNGIFLNSANNATVQCNNIGTDVTGTIDQGNVESGIVLASAPNTLLGTDGDGVNDGAEGNLLSGNGGQGIYIQQSPGVTVAGNLIGTKLDGSSALGNSGHGILLLGGSHTNAIGGLPVQANTIAHNGRDGVHVNGTNGGSDRNAILGNRIFSNAGLGIDLVGVSANDAGDPDTGANQGQNTPVLTSALVNPKGDVIVAYSVDTDTSNATYPLRVEFFLADADSSEGMTLLGSHSYASSVAQDTVTTTFTPAIALSSGDHIVATATDADGNTSEFSASLPFLTGATQGTVNATADRSDANPGDGICYTGQTNSAGNAECTLRAAIEEAQTLSGNPTIQFAIPAATDTGCDSSTGVCTIKPQSQLPLITETLNIDGTTQTGATCGTSFASRDLKVVLDGSQAGSAMGLFLDQATKTTVRGLVIHSFQMDGILLNKTDYAGVQCTFLGTDVTGTADKGNGGSGIGVVSATNTLIGTEGNGYTDGAEGNLVSGNTQNGIYLNVQSTSTVVSGNLIGTQIDGTSDLGNSQWGIFIIQGSHTNTIGGGLPVQANTIAHNGRDGVHVNGLHVGNDRNQILSNRIFSNGGLGIDLGGVSTNDAGDPDTGANQGQNHPVMTLAAVKANGDLTVSYAVDTDTSNATYPLRVEFFLADADSSEGMTLLGSHSYASSVAQDTVTTTFTPTIALSGGEHIVATATDADGNTSEFSASLPFLTGTTQGTVNATADRTDTNPGDGICYTGQANSAGTPECTLRAAIEETNALAGADAIKFAIPSATDTGCDSSTGVCTIKPQSQLPLITETLTLDGTTQTGATCGTSFASRDLKVVLDGSQAGFSHGLYLFHGSNSTVRGLVVHSFHYNGLNIRSNSTTIQCNFVGTDVTGTLDKGNDARGIILHFSSNSLIGTDGDGTNDGAEGNLVSGNAGRGITLLASSDVAISGNRIAGNLIGTKIDGTSALGNNGSGIRIQLNAQANTIGGLLPVQANTIAHNGLDGVRVNNFIAGNDRNEILGNRIFANGGLGINLEGVSANDAGDPDTSVNQGQNHPDITLAAIQTNADVAVSYSVDTDTSNATYPLRVEFFLADADSSEGMTLLGSHSYASSVAQDTVTTTFTPAVALSIGDHIVATATDADGNTSEFSTSLPFLTGLTQGTVNATADRTDANPGDGICYTGQTNNAGNAECTLRAAIEEANALTGANTIQFAIPAATDAGCNSTTEVCTIQPQSALPTITQTLTIDGTTQAGATCGTSFASRALKLVLDGTNAGYSNGLLLTLAPNSTVQGLVIHSFQSEGIELNSLSNATIQCNFVGTDVTGTVDKGNGGSGIGVVGATNTLIGTDGDGVNDGAEGNLVSGNAYKGVLIYRATGATVTGNLIGAQVDGSSALGNSSEGVAILGGSHTNTVGGLLPVQANTIAYNLKSGVTVSNDDADNVKNSILGNRIFSNGVVGIDLTGVSANDAGDADTGANKGQNHPVMTLAVVKTNGDVAVSYSVDTDTSNATYPLRVEFFKADADTSEGMTFLGSHSYTAANAQSAVSNTFTPAVTLSSGDYIVATATDALGNTSEFSASLSFIIGATQGTVNATADRSDANPGDGLCYTGQTNSTGNAECTLRAAMEEAQALAGADSIQFAIPAATDAGCDSTTGVCTIQPQSELPTITGTLTVDGTTQTRATCGTSFATRDLKVVLDGSQAGNSYGLRISRPSNSTVRGLVIHSFQRAGIILNNAPNAAIQCNFVGTDVTGMIGQGNGGHGIEIIRSNNTLIGTDGNGALDGAEGNLLSGNHTGISISNATTGVRVAGNLIGTKIDGTSALGNNGWGIFIQAGSHMNTIGGLLPAQANTIAHNGRDGVVVWNTAVGTDRNEILGNRIFSNTGLGIDLVGVSANDAGDADTGANKGQNTPVMTSAALSSGDLQVSYSVDTATSNATYPLRVEFFLADADTSEGTTYLGSHSYMVANAQSTTSTTFTPSVALSGGDYIVATATDADGNTSEFSAATSVTGTASGITVMASLWLEGPFGSSSMTPGLSQYLPQSDPYNLGQSVATASFFTTDSNGQQVVDWIWLELRTGDPAGPMTTVATTAALLMADGSLKATDAMSNASFSGISPGSYYLVIGHRNSLAVMSPTALDCTSGSCSHDFRTAQAQAYGSAPMKDLGSSHFGLYTGDADGDGQVIASDYQLYWRPQNGSSSGYHSADFDLDGQVIASDYQLYWRPNNSRESRVPPASVNARVSAPVTTPVNTTATSGPDRSFQQRSEN